MTASLLCIVCSGCRNPRRPDTVQEVFHDGAVTVTDVHFHSSSIDGMFWYRIIEPQVGPNERLPVLYFLHGIDSDPREVMQHSSVLKLATASRLIIVMPAAGYSYYTNAKHKRNARWEDAVAQELPRDVEKRFPVLSGREHAGVAGISMGGYGAVKLALKHPELYGFAGNMSGPLDITRREASLRRWGQTLRIWNTFGMRPNIRRDEDVFDLLNRAVEVKSVTWFESCGKNAALLSVNERFARKLRERGVGLDLITTSGGHDWQSWNAAMPDLFRIAEKVLR
jgi:putative tributyrin esterase